MGVPIGTHEFVNVFVRSKAHAIEQDVQKLLIVQDPKIHYDSASIGHMSLFYSVTAHLVSWLGSLPHASEWVAGQNLADPTTWNSSVLQTLNSFMVTC
jgi:hypothetical protein